MSAVGRYSCRTSGDPIESRRYTAVHIDVRRDGERLADYKAPWLSDSRLLKFSCAVSSCLETDTPAGGPKTPSISKTGRRVLGGQNCPHTRYSITWDADLLAAEVSSREVWRAKAGCCGNTWDSLVAETLTGSWRGVIHSDIIVQRTMWPLHAQPQRKQPRDGGAQSTSEIWCCFRLLSYVENGSYRMLQI